MKTDYKKISSGIHTLQLKCLVTKGYNDLMEYCNNNCCPVWTNKKYPTKITTYGLYFNQGITILLKRYDNPANPMYLNYLNIGVNPSQLFHKKWETRIFKATPKNLKKLETKIKEAISALPDIGKALEDFKIFRCDLCTDILFHNKQMVENYIKLCKCRGTPNGYTVYDEYSATGHRTVPPDDSVYLKRLAYYINVYNKQAEMKSKPQKYNKEAVKRAKGLLRTEIQFNSSKINYATSNLVKEPKSFSDKIGALCAISQDMCHSVITHAFLPGQHFTLEQAVDIVNHRKGRAGITAQLEFLLRKTTKHRDFQKGLEMVMQEYSTAKLNTLINVLKDLDINPVCLPAKWLGKDAFIPSLSNLLDPKKEQS